MGLWRRVGITVALMTGLGLIQASAQVMTADAGTRHNTTPPGGTQMLAAPVNPIDAELGRRIYREGIGANGQAIVGLRFGGIEAKGQTVACMNCHRRSGLGSVEGTDLVAPIAGRFLFQDEQRAVVSMNFRNVKNFNQKHVPLDEASFAAAMRQGLHVTGRELSPIMPRFELSDPELRGLTAYLRTLSAEWSPGVDAKRIQFATVITPDVSPERRQLFLDTLQAAVAQKNGNVAQGQRTMSTAAEMLFRTDRHWDVAVWTLQGPPETWSAQLDERYRANPVFALVSGVGAGTWEPVHQFCERQQVPCWFPSVNAPPAQARQDFYSVYFSGGVNLEADVLARHLSDLASTSSKASTSLRRVVQLHRGDAAGEVASARLRASLAQLKSKLKVETRVVNGTDASALQHALAGVGPRDALMLWWPEADVPSLSSLTPPKETSVYMSGRMGNPDHADLPPNWKAAVQVIYPYQMPDKRAAGLFYFQSWLKIRSLPLRDEVMQSEVYFAMTYLSETLTDMLDNVHRDYLLERAESMLSLREGAKAEDEARELTVARHQKTPGGAQAAMARLNLPENRKSPRPMPGRTEHVMARRDSTTIYPRMGLGQGQRFASKGAYIARFGGSDGQTLTPISDWIVP